ncbi:unnamed protein product [Rotaria magnacalcarata]|uniref:Surfeit locus protein 4 n=1 Tax=Rotaria magnacalcarata TaxID=392030 RepID=A0A816HDP8_9BILA|nr:unnamed protein product [Rotaria magnacalcarata]CAF1684781.1 unnamed protein product [Rotaria magnacalcarata]CAF2043210.1 unnamed protein product [Rotaria magnacalcarata]CAF2050022.1 unnamed protein product [Rotaria magnacalcarata]CAF2206883.1 unnamed protein product [Rotaria magnacalcarata]
MNLVTPKQRKEWFSRAEDYADTFLHHTKHFLPHVARFCLVATFLEDGIRMWMQWTEQREYIMKSWSVGWLIGTLFVIINLFGQLVPCGMILTRKKTDIACGMLVFIIGFQAIAYQIIWELRFLLRSCSLVGGLILLMVENRKEARSLFAGVPTIHNNAPKNYMQLAGRMLLVIMFLTIVRYELTFMSILQNLIGGICMLFVAVGFKTKLSALFLVVYLTSVNFYLNCFWLVPNHRALHDFLKYDFFQTMSVIGGLLYVVALGPGGVSLDARKKEW